jgi:hypothetical protein
LPKRRSEGQALERHTAAIRCEKPGITLWVRNLAVTSYLMKDCVSQPIYHFYFSPHSFALKLSDANLNWQ